VLAPAPAFRPQNKRRRAGSLHIMERLLSAGADPNSPSASGLPLFWAANALQPGAVAALLRAGADANEQSSRGLTPVFMAVAAGSEACAKELLVFCLRPPPSRATTPPLVS
jgi:ankyrin repeat protein